MLMCTGVSEIPPQYTTTSTKVNSNDTHCTHTHGNKQLLSKPTIQLGTIHIHMFIAIISFLPTIPPSYMYMYLLAHNLYVADAHRVCMCKYTSTLQWMRKYHSSHSSSCVQLTSSKTTHGSHVYHFCTLCAYNIIEYSCSPSLYKSLSWWHAFQVQGGHQGIGWMLNLVASIEQHITVSSSTNLIPNLPDKHLKLHMYVKRGSGGGNDNRLNFVS